MATISIYCLRLTSGKYYIGISKNPWRRWLQHVKGTGAIICRYDKPKERIFTIDTKIRLEILAKAVEDHTTLVWMKEYGPKNVIGGRYLTEDYRKVNSSWIEAELERTRGSINRVAMVCQGMIDIEEIPKAESSGAVKLNETNFEEDL